MTLFLSDLHLGRGSRDATREAERDAVALLRAHEREVVEEAGALVLLGDVYDQFIEYRHLVPKTGARLVGLLADWADRGARVLYAVGNRDPWHLDFFARDVGVEVVRGGWTGEIEGVPTYIAHGDGLVPAERTTALFQPLLRAPLMARLYRMGLPGDAGFALARWTSRRFGTDGAPDGAASAALAAAARDRLRTTDARLVAHGHTHEARLDHADGGVYLNPGYWFGARTFARLDASGPALYRWDRGRALPL